MNNKSSKKFLKDERGFTLIELLTVISTLSILSALAIPSFYVYKRNAAYSIAQATVKNARIAREAGITNPEIEPVAVGFVTQNSPGTITDATAKLLLPGLVLPKKTKISVQYDPTCNNASCQSSLLQVDHCDSSEHVRWILYGDGHGLLMEHLSGSNC